MDHRSSSSSVDASGQVTPTPNRPYGNLKNEPHRLSLGKVQIDSNDDDRTPTGEGRGGRLTDGVDGVKGLSDGVAEVPEINGVGEGKSKLEGRESSEVELSPESKPRS